MLRKTFIILSASAMLGAAVIVSNGAFAFGPPPIGGPPPGLGGPPPGLGGLPHLGGSPLPHLGGPAPRLGDLPPRGPAPRASLGGPASRLNGLSRFGGRAAASGYGRSGGYGYSRSADSGYGRGEWRHRYGRYGVYIAGSGSSSSDDGCYYTYTSSGRRVMVCDEN